jgi:hypothetical protein
MITSILVIVLHRALLPRRRLTPAHYTQSTFSAGAFRRQKQYRASPQLFHPLGVWLIVRLPTQRGAGRHEKRIHIERTAIMKTNKLILSAAALVTFFVPAVFAQQPANTPADPQSIAQRKDNQQDRIAQGVQSGQLTPHETANLENKEAGLNHEEHNMREADNGHLTGADRAKINRQQNHLSHQIYDKKHNGRTR